MRYLRRSGVDWYIPSARAGTVCLLLAACAVAPATPAGAQSRGERAAKGALVGGLIGAAVGGVVMAAQHFRDRDRDFKVEPASLDFDEVRAGASFDRTITLRNRGTRNLRVDRILLGGPGSFSLPDQPQVPIVLQPGGRLEVNVRFRPSTGGKASGSIEIVGARGGNTDSTRRRVALKGKGVA